MNFGPRVAMEVSTGTIIRFVLLVLGVIFLYLIRDIALIVIASIVIASAVEPIVKFLTRWRIPRTLSVLVVYLVGIVGFFALFYSLVPPLFNDFQSFVRTLPEVLASALTRLQEFVGPIPVDAAIEGFRQYVTGTEFSLKDLLAGFFNTTSSFFSGIFSFGLVIVLSFYLAVQEDGISNVLRIVTPKEYEEYILSLWKRSEQKIGRWLQGQMLLGVIVGVLVFIALSVLHVRFAFSLAVLAAVFEIIPYFGPVLSAIPGVAVASIQDPFLGLIVLGIYVVVQQMENHLIYPQVVRKTVGVPPMLAIIALLIGGKLAGGIGFIIAIPVAVIIMEYLNDVERKKRLTV